MNDGAPRQVWAPDELAAPTRPDWQPATPRTPGRSRHPARRLGGLVLAVVCAVAAWLAVGRWVNPAIEEKRHGPVRELTVPPSIGKYRLQSGPAARRTAAALRDDIARTPFWRNRDVSRVKIGVYRRGDRQLIFAGFGAKDYPDLGRNRSPGRTVDEGLHGLGVSRPTQEQAGPLGGVLRCGQVVRPSQRFSACAWADASTAGLVASADLAPARLAQATRTVRSAVEH
ncbi:hypothetical protein [Spirillospora sp. CA-294931]|uniref:hypothetical protein n=1 Tax=Spirillospora sp. CA-294931 TaxID=3240042 RepID=UPI003D8B416A